jgi:hypothetical protein
VPGKAVINGEPSLDGARRLPRRLTEEELYDKVRVVIGE